jgi:hypothetical protein
MRKLIISIVIASLSFMGLSNAQAADLPGLTPSFNTYTSEVGGFTVQINNYSSSYSWAVTVSSGAYSINSSGLITVTGLSSGATANVNVTTSRAGYTTVSQSTNGQAIQRFLGVTPSLTASTPTRNGFRVQINNFSSSYIWSSTASAGTTSAPTSTGIITVSGVPRGQQVTVTVYVNSPGFTGSQSTVTFAALPPPTSISPIIGNVSIISDGFTIPITNFDDWFTWNITSSSGQATIDANGLITVRGNDSTKLALVSITVVYSGTTYARVSTIGYSNTSALRLTPTILMGDVRADGFQTTITNYDPLYTWSVSSDDAQVFIDANGLIDVSGMDIGQKAEITISQRVLSGPQSSWTFTGQSFPSFGYLPKLGSLSAQSTSFAFQISNYNSFYDYEITTTRGVYAISSNGKVTVSKLPKGGSATVTVKTSRDGNPGASSKIRGVATLTISNPRSSTSAVPNPTGGSSDKSATVTPDKGSSGNKTIICKDKNGVKKFVTGKAPVCPKGFTKQ